MADISKCAASPEAETTRVAPETKARVVLCRTSRRVMNGCDQLPAHSRCATTADQPSQTRTGGHVSDHVPPEFPRRPARTGARAAGPPTRPGFESRPPRPTGRRRRRRPRRRCRRRVRAVLVACSRSYPACAVTCDRLESGGEPPATSLNLTQPAPHPHGVVAGGGIQPARDSRDGRLDRRGVLMLVGNHDSSGRLPGGRPDAGLHGRSRRQERRW